MAMLLRKLCESVSLKRSTSNSNPNSSSSSSSSERAHSPLGSFHSLPPDILIQIIRLLGPKQAAKLSLVCKSWRSIVSDNNLWVHFFQTQQPQLWDSILFSETTLTSGYPLPTLVTTTQARLLSFKNVYGQRERLPGAVIIDGGSGYCKFGWSNHACPLGRTATYLGLFGKPFIMNKQMGKKKSVLLYSSNQYPQLPVCRLGRNSTVIIEITERKGN